MRKGRDSLPFSRLFFSIDRMPDSEVPYDYTNTQTFQLLLAVGEKEKALEMTDIQSKRANDLAGYYLRKREFGRDLQVPIVILGELQRVLFENGETEAAEKSRSCITSITPRSRTGDSSTDRIFKACPQS